jgi:transcription elongation factor Elf1
MSNWNQQRQATRNGGKYAPLPPCPRCGKRKCVEPCYVEGSKWEGLFVCAPCVKAEEKAAKGGG